MKYERIHSKLRLTFNRTKDSEQRLISLDIEKENKKKSINFSNLTNGEQNIITYATEFEDMNVEGSVDSDEMDGSQDYIYYINYEVTLYNFPLKYLPFIKSSVIFKGDKEMLDDVNARTMTTQFCHIEDLNEELEDWDKLDKTVTLYVGAFILRIGDELELQSKLLIAFQNPKFIY